MCGTAFSCVMHCWRVCYDGSRDVTSRRKSNYHRGNCHRALWKLSCRQFPHGARRLVVRSRPRRILRRTSRKAGGVDARGKINQRLPTPLPLPRAKITQSLEAIARTHRERDVYANGPIDRHLACRYSHCLVRSLRIFGNA